MRIATYYRRVLASVNKVCGLSHLQQRMVMVIGPDYIAWIMYGEAAPSSDAVNTLP